MSQEPAIRPSPERTSGLSKRFFAGFGLVSTAVLLLQLTLTRIFSVSIWYHFAFMVVSIALLGVGASGSVIAVFRPGLLARIERTVLVAGLLFAAASLGALATAALVPFDPSRLAAEPLPQGLFLLAYYVGLALPFLAAGVVVGAVLSAFADRAGQLYCADLVGAGSGCLLFIVALPLLGAQGSVALAALLAIVAVGLMVPGTARLLAPLVVPLALLAATLQGLVDIHIPSSKGLAAALGEEGTRRVLTRWNALSRIDVTEGDRTRFFAGLSPRYTGELPEQIALRIDADARTDITRLEGGVAPLRYLDHLSASLPYQLVEHPSVLVIGAGGGTDVVAALYHGATHVTAVEINPLIVDLVRHRYGAFSGYLYDDQRVRVLVDEGRNYVARSRERYDVIQMSLVDTWAAASSGAYSLSENYLYTREAFRDYLGHLTDRGVLGVSRWSRQPPVELLRLASTALAALHDLGVAEPARHIAIVQTGDLATTVVKRQPLTDADVAAIRAFAERNDFHVVYPRAETDNEVAAFIAAPDRAALIERYPYNIAPTTDDSPFFFQYARWRDLAPAQLVGNANDHHFFGQIVLLAALAQAVVLGGVLILAPLVLHRRLRRALANAPRLPTLAYFAGLGLAFMFVEIALMQRLALLLGHPVYAISVVLFTLLVAGGVGSLATSRVPLAATRGTLALAVPTLAVAIGFHLALLPELVQRLLGEPLGVRVLAAVALVAPLGVLMGMPFPLGIRMVQAARPELVPWAWGINGCASVVGPVLAVVIAMAGSFTVVMMLAAALYLVALVAALVLHPMARVKPYPAPEP
ncbi:MAG TPA: hypothetical protein VIN09_03005 [Chloroflexota bacterium]